MRQDARGCNSPKHAFLSLRLPCCRYVNALVAASDDIGAGVCVSVASIDRETGSVLDFREAHVSSSSSSSDSSGANGAAGSSNGGDSSSGGNFTAPGSDDGAVDVAAGGNGTLPELPAGKVLTAWSVGPSGQCAAYNASSGEWHNIAAFPFGRCKREWCSKRLCACLDWLQFGRTQLLSVPSIQVLD